jgi:putative spermidine/putrescine transport system permease protein
MSRRRGPPRLGRWLLRATVALVLLFLIAPALIVIPLSFAGDAMTRFPPSQFSLLAYRNFLYGPGWVDSTLFSLGMAGTVMVLSMVIGTLTAYGIVSAGGRLKRALSILVLLPMMVPTIIFAIATYWLLADWRVLGTFAGFVVANLVLAVPYAIITIRNGMEGLDRSLQKAASILGARPARIFLKVTAPLLLPALATGGLFAFLVAFDEVVVAQFVSGSFAVPLPKRMWDGILYRWDPAISAISTIQIAITVAVLVILGLLRRREEQDRSKREV